MSYKVYSAASSHKRKRQYEKFTKPSLTVPDQVLSIREIIVRYTRGETLEGHMEGFWEADDDADPDSPHYPTTEEIGHMDLVDQAMVLDEIKEDIATHNKRQAEARKATEARVKATDVEPVPKA
jgi:hypothetical protein